MTPSEGASVSWQARTPARILFVEGNQDGTIGGSFFSLLHLVENLDRSQFEPVVVFACENSLLGRFRQAGATIHIRPLARPCVLPGVLGRAIAKCVNFVIGFVVEPIGLAAFMSRESVRLVHLNNSISSNHTWAIGAFYARIPCVTHERGINPRYSKRSIWIGRRLSAVVCISVAVRDNLLAGGASGLKMHIIPNGLDPAVMRVERPRASVCHEFGIPTDSRIIGIVGNIKSWKGQDIVVRALARLQETVPGLVCLLVGDCAPADADYMRVVDRTIEELGLGGKVIVTGYRANVADFIAVMEILVHASTSPEPFGRVLLEGMALRKPIVASRDGAVTEIVEDGETGLLFSPSDADDLHRCLSRLMQDRCLASRLGDAGYRRLVEKFHVDRNAFLTQALYRQVLRKGKVGD